MSFLSDLKQLQYTNNEGALGVEAGGVRVEVGDTLAPATHAFVVTA